MKSDDYRLTAYLLGEELSPEDRATVEKALNKNPELLEQQNDLKELSNLLETAYEKDISENQTQKTEEILEKTEQKKISLFPRFIAYGSTMAACFALYFGLQEAPVEDTKLESPKPVQTPSSNLQSLGTKEVIGGELDADAEGVHKEDGRIAVQIEGKKRYIPGPPPSVRPTYVPEPPVTGPPPTTRTTKPSIAASSRKAPVINSTKYEEIEEEQSQGEDVYMMNPFEVATAEDVGYLSTNSTSGTRLNTGLKDFPTKKRMAKKVVAKPQMMMAEAVHCAMPAVAADASFNTESYDSISENAFLAAMQNPLSTFSVDVDTASYANVRRYLNNGNLPPAGAIRTEEIINYFNYDYEVPQSLEQPFSVSLESSDCFWSPEHQLVQIGLKGYEIPWEERSASNLVFLIDTSGSMNSGLKLDLVKKALNKLVEKLDARDRVAIVTYAGSSRIALPSTTANNTETITFAMNNLNSSGSTHGSAGIRKAYEMARKHFVEDGNNRVILCTDGDFNVGTTNRSELVELIEKEASTGVFLSIFGFGMGNYKDSTLEELSNKGNGNYGYIDSEKEAKKVFVDGASGTLISIAKDVKIQVEFNPNLVQSYRLIGYENRKLAKEDFNDDTKDAGEIGSGHTVTALYEIVPLGAGSNIQPKVDDLKYQKVEKINHSSDELLTVKIRYKQPDEDVSKKLEFPFMANEQSFEESSENLRFASIVAGYAQLLRKSEYTEDLNWNQLLREASKIIQSNSTETRSEFLNLIQKAQKLSENK